ncbi:hypothetical protein CBR_g37034 [Chara braunii]|uniref:DUF659 domain-containing protein n=1 Tax=Chara braunii TaxID=69332 RepID=A0A388LM30_CHABU|nr:hypothetical protein CBR_g37034 [Chara braunii]|eukprot:GBG83321.1 hypothetical protein CBR_g37034 [Chara braunii]
MYAKENLAEFTDAWLQWIYVKGLPFNASYGLEFQKVQQVAERVPRSIEFRSPSSRVTAGAGIPSQRAKVATMVSEVRAAFRHSGASILSDRRKSRSGKPLVNFLAEGANGALLYATVARDGSVRDTVDIVYSRWRAIILSFPAKDVIGFCYDSASNYTEAARRFATDPEPDIRRITWLPFSTHVCNLMLSDIETRVGWVKDTIIFARALVRFIKSHGAAHTLFRKVSPRVQLVEPVETRFTSVFLMLTCLKGRRDVLDSMLHGDAWARIPWKRKHVSQAQWVQQQIRDEEFWRWWWLHVAMGYGDRSGGTTTEDEDEDGDVEPEVWGARPAGSVPEQEIQRQIVAFGDSRPSRAHSVRDVFGIRATELRPWPEGGDDVDAAAADDDIDDELTDDDDTPLSSDPTTERVCFTYGGGRDDMDSFTSVITGGAPWTAQASGSSRAGGGCGGRSHAEVGVDNWGEEQPRGGLRQTGRRWEFRSNSEAEEEAEDERVPLHDRCFSPSHHRSAVQPEALRRSERLASAAGRNRAHDGEDRGGERIPSDAGIRPCSPSVLRTHDFDTVGLGGSLGDFSVEGRQRASPSEVRTDADVVRGPVETEEERDARLDREEEERLGSLPRSEGRFAYLDKKRRQRELETGAGGGRDVDDSGVPEEAVQGEFDDEGQYASAGGGSGGGRHGDGETAGDDGQDVVVGGGSPSGGRGDSETAGDEGQGAAVYGRGEGGPGGDGDTAGVGGDGGPDVDDDDDHGPEDDAYRLALVLRDPAVPPLRPDDLAHIFFDVDALAQAGVRGRESGASDVGSGRRSDGGRDIAGSMPPAPACPPEARVDVRGQTATPEVAHSGGSPPTVRAGVGGGWSSVRRVGDQLWADYDVGRGVFSGRTPVETQGVCRPWRVGPDVRACIWQAACMDMMRGEQFTSGEQGLLMRPGTRRQHGLSEVEARLASGVAAGQAALDAIQREREMGIAARAAEDEDADTEFEPMETVARRHRAQVAAAAAAAQAAYLSGARGTGAGGRGRRRGEPHENPIATASNVQDGTPRDCNNFFPLFRDHVWNTARLQYFLSAVS